MEGQLQLQLQCRQRPAPLEEELDEAAAAAPPVPTAASRRCFPRPGAEAEASTPTGVSRLSRRRPAPLLGGHSLADDDEATSWCDGLPEADDMPAAPRHAA